MFTRFVHLIIFRWAKPLASCDHGLTKPATHSTARIGTVHSELPEWGGSCPENETAPPWLTQRRVEYHAVAASDFSFLGQSNSKPGKASKTQTEGPSQPPSASTTFRHLWSAGTIAASSVPFKASTPACSLTSASTPRLTLGAYRVRD